MMDTYLPVTTRVPIHPIVSEVGPGDDGEGTCRLNASAGEGRTGKRACTRYRIYHPI